MKRVSNFVTAVLHLNRDSINIPHSTPPYPPLKPAASP